MSHFFSVYKNLEHKETLVNEVENVEEAKKIIAQTLENYIEKFCR